MNYKLDKKKFDNIYFEGKSMYDKVNGGTFNVVYMREYIDPENECETFGAYETIYRNVPNKYRSKFDNEKMKMNITLLIMTYSVRLVITKKTKKECLTITVNVGIDHH
jgi:hypothetical protein